MKKKDIEKSAVAEHSYKTKHAVDFDRTKKVLVKIPHYFFERVRETVEFVKHEDNFNKEDSL